MSALSKIRIYPVARLLATLLITAICLTACIGGDDDSAGIDGSGSPIRTATRGEIEGFGSVIVNGTRFNTDTAVITMDGNDAALSDLSIGHIVTILAVLGEEGTDPVAEAIVYNSNVIGPISNIDGGSGTISVFGITVYINPVDTLSDDFDTSNITGPDGLQVGDIVRVSGYDSANGSVLASRVDVLESVSEYVVTGRVKNNQPGPVFTFEINGLLIDYEFASISDFFDNDDHVMVKSNSLPDEEENIFIADSITVLEDFSDLLSGLPGSVEGVISELYSDGRFVIDSGNIIRSTDDTTYIDGTESNIAWGVRVKVRGEFNNGGELVADEIEILPSTDAFVQQGRGVATAIVGDTLVMGNHQDIAVTIFFDENTVFEDKLSPPGTEWGFEDIDINDLFKIWGSQFDPEDSRNVLASRIERHSTEQGVIMQGLSEPRGEFFTLYQTEFTVSNSLPPPFFDENGEEIQVDDFYEAIDTGLAEENPWIIRIRISENDTYLEGDNIDAAQLIRQQTPIGPLLP